MKKLKQEKPLLTYTTKSIRSELNEKEIAGLTSIFTQLHRLYPGVERFAISRTAESNHEINVWFVVDEYQHNIFGTMMFPSDN